MQYELPFDCLSAGLCHDPTAESWRCAEDEDEFMSFDFDCYTTSYAPRPKSRRIVLPADAQLFLETHAKEIYELFPNIHTLGMDYKIDFMGQIDKEAGFLLTAFTEQREIVNWPEEWSGVRTQLITRCKDYLTCK